MKYLAEVERWARAGARPVAEITGDLLENIPPVGSYEYCGGDTSFAEAMILGLRLLDGMDLEAESVRVGEDLASRFDTEIGDLVDLGLLDIKGSGLRLTKPAYLIANQVFNRFV